LTRTYDFGSYRNVARCYYRVSPEDEKLRIGFVQVFLLDSIISPMHAVCFVADDLHGGCRIDPCSSEICTVRMAEIVDSQVRNSSPTTGSLKGSSNPMNRFLFIQEYPICVQSLFLP